MAVKVPVTLSPVDTKKVDAAIARIQSRAKGVDFGGGAKSLEKLSRPLGKITGQANEFTKSLDASNARVLAFGASVAVINKLSQAFGALVANTIKVEASFAKIGVILGGTEQQLRAFGDGIFNVAKKTATSFEEVADGALELARQGLGVEESLARVETALKLVRVAGVDSQEAVAGLTAAIKGFEGAGITVAQIADKLAEVDTKFAVSTEDLINGLERASASARVAGVSFDELLGVITTVQERTQRGGAVIGNAFKTIFARLGRTDTLVALEELGIQVLDSQGNVRSAIPLFQDLAVELDKLGLKSIAAGEIIQKVAGVRQRDILISLIEDLNSGQSQFSKSLQVSANAAGALDAKNEKLNQTLEALIANTVTAGRELASIIGEIGFADAAKDILSTFSSVLGTLKDLFQGDTLGSDFARGIIKGIGGVLTGPGLALITAIFIKLFIDLAKFGSQSLKQILGINKAAQQQKILQQSVLQTLLQNENIQREILALEGNKVAQEQLLLRIYNQQAAALARIQKTAATVTPGLFRGGFRGGERGITRRSAGGYVAAEARDISRGVGGANAGSRVVSIPNFAFGGGKHGTMVANTSEYYVPNYAGGGDAIFNRDMIKTMGLPSGARKLNASVGYVPNFAKKGLPISDKGGRFAMVVPSQRGLTTQEGTAPSGQKYKFPVVGYNKSNLKAKNDDQLKKDIKDFAIKLSKEEAKTITKSQPLPGKLGAMNEGAIGGLAGSVFEAVISSLIRGPQFDQTTTATFDFIGSSAAKQLREGLFAALPATATFVEAKIRGTDSKLRNSMAKKMETYGAGKKTIGAVGKREIKAARQRVVGGSVGRLSRDKTIKSEFKGTSFASRGYIPNFVDPLTDAIQREQEAGVPINQIRINQKGTLRNGQNPMGLAVTNTRDEPTGRIPNFIRKSEKLGLGKNPIPNSGPGTATIAGLGTEAKKTSSALQTISDKALGLSIAFSFVGSALEGTESKLGQFASTAANTISLLAASTLVIEPLQGLGKGLGDIGGKVSTFGASLSGTGNAFGSLLGGAGSLLSTFGRFLPVVGVLITAFTVLLPILSKFGKETEDASDRLKKLEGEVAEEKDTAVVQRREQLLIDRAAQVTIRDEQLQKAADVQKSIDITKSSGKRSNTTFSESRRDAAQDAADAAQAAIDEIDASIIIFDERLAGTAKEIEVARKTGGMGPRTAAGASAFLDQSGALTAGRFAAQGVGTSGALTGARAKADKAKLDIAQAVTKEAKLQAEIDLARANFNLEADQARFGVTEQFVTLLKQGDTVTGDQLKVIEDQVKAGGNLNQIQKELADKGIELTGETLNQFNIAKKQLDLQNLQLTAKKEELETQIEIKKESLPGSFQSGLNKGFGRLQDRVDGFAEKIGDEIPNRFADGLGRALSDALSGAKDLDEALSAAGKNFLDYIAEAFMQQAAAQAVAPLKNVFSTVLSSVAGAFGGSAASAATSTATAGSNFSFFNVDTSFQPSSYMSSLGYGGGGGFSFPARGGLIKGFNRGGAVGSDVVPAMLTPGEFIMSRDAVNKYGLEMLTRMNEGVTSMATMQNGGLISPAAAPVGGNSSQVNNNSEFTFNIQGGNTEQQQGGQQESMQDREFAKRIRSAVTQVVSEESRRGGSLAYLYTQ